MVETRLSVPSTARTPSARRSRWQDSWAVRWAGPWPTRQRKRSQTVCRCRCGWRPASSWSLPASYGTSTPIGMRRDCDRPPRNRADSRSDLSPIPTGCPAVPQSAVPPTVGPFSFPARGAGWPSVSEVGVTAHNTGVTGGLGRPASVLEAKLRVHLPLEEKEEERPCLHLFRERVTGSNSLMRRGSDRIHSPTNRRLKPKEGETSLSSWGRTA
jgi:hypothetical protein